MQNDFIVVKSKKNRRSKRNQIALQSCPPVEEIASLTDYSALERKLKNIIGHLEEEQFSFDLVNDLNNVLTNIGRTQIETVLCYGLGNFSQSSSSLHQLAILLHLQKTYNFSVKIYDPVFNEGEIDFLRGLKFEVTGDNEEGKHVINSGELTLGYFPHCPKQLVNNFLWANWNENLSNCIVIGNSFTTILDTNTKRTIEESANYISKALVHCEEIPIKDSYRIPNVFNDTSIHFFRRLVIDSTIPAEEPKYRDDPEFIRRKNEFHE